MSAAQTMDLPRLIVEVSKTSEGDVGFLFNLYTRESHPWGEKTIAKTNDVDEVFSRVLQQMVDDAETPTA